MNCGVPGHYIKLQEDWLSNAHERHLDTSMQYNMMAVNMMSSLLTDFSRQLFGGFLGSFALGLTQ